VLLGVGQREPSTIEAHKRITALFSEPKGL
jgi:hypothetical protein